MRPGFDWDEDKARTNEQKHLVSFEEAETVFTDPFSVTYEDPEHSQGEERLKEIRLSERGRLIAVIYTERAGVLRLINARPVTLRERNDYETGN